MCLSIKRRLCHWKQIYHLESTECTPKKKLEWGKLNSSLKPLEIFFLGCWVIYNLKDSNNWWWLASNSHVKVLISEWPYLLSVPSLWPMSGKYQYVTQSIIYPMRSFISIHNNCFCCSLHFSLPHIPLSVLPTNRSSSKQTHAERSTPVVWSW